MEVVVVNQSIRAKKPAGASLGGARAANDIPT
jgi:hypothetical protein